MKILISDSNVIEKKMKINIEKVNYIKKYWNKHQSFEKSIGRKPKFLKIHDEFLFNYLSKPEIL